jgi:hypothetical protein
MTVDTAQRRAAVEPSRAVLYGVLALAAISVAGAVISVAGDLSPSLLDAMGPDGRLSIPLPMIAAQVVLAVAAGARRRGVALTGSALLAAALLVSVISGFFDGGYSDDRLTAFERAGQVTLVAALSTVAIVAAVRFWRVLRSSER